MHEITFEVIQTYSRSPTNRFCGLKIQFVVKKDQCGQNKLFEVCFACRSILLWRRLPGVHKSYRKNPNSKFLGFGNPISCKKHINKKLWNVRHTLMKINFKKMILIWVSTCKHVMHLTCLNSSCWVWCGCYFWWFF